MIIKIKVACSDSVGYKRDTITSQQVALENYKISKEASSSWVKIFCILKFCNKTDISFFMGYRYQCFSSSFFFMDLKQSNTVIMLYQYIPCETYFFHYIY